MTLPTLEPILWGFLATAAALVGVSKTALPGINTLSIAAFAAILPARASTGALLLLLLVGDACALLSYRKHAHWPTLLRLVPAVLTGVALGAIFLAIANDSGVQRVIGMILLAVITVSLWQRRRASSVDAQAQRDTDLSTSRLAVTAYGTLGGFTTMVANAGGPVMSMYFLAARFPIQQFLGTAAWFFAVINLVKLPVSISLGLITPQLLVLAIGLAPFVVLGAVIGRWITAHLRQTVFTWLVSAGTVLGAVFLIFA